MMFVDNEFTEGDSGYALSDVRSRNWLLPLLRHAVPLHCTPSRVAVSSPYSTPHDKSATTSPCSKSLIPVYSDTRRGNYNRRRGGWGQNESTFNLPAIGHVITSPLSRHHFRCTLSQVAAPVTSSLMRSGTCCGRHKLLFCIVGATLGAGGGAGVGVWERTYPCHGDTGTREYGNTGNRAEFRMTGAAGISARYRTNASSRAVISNTGYDKFDVSDKFIFTLVVTMQIPFYKNINTCNKHEADVIPCR